MHESQAALTGSDAHHLADVMRARQGDEVVLCGPDGLEYTGTVTALLPGRVEFSEIGRASCRERV